MKKTLLITLALIAVLLLAVGFTLPSKAMQSKPSYEYKFVNAPSEKKANEVASQGWELVAIDSTSKDFPTFVFKRSKQ